MSESSQTIQLETVVVQGDGHISAGMDGEVALMHIDNGSYYVLNDTSSRVWELMESPKSVAEICDTIEHEFEVDSNQCRNEILEHLSELASHKLIKTTTAAA